MYIENSKDNKQKSCCGSVVYVVCTNVWSIYLEIIVSMKNIKWMLLLPAVLFASFSYAADWPTYRHDNHRSGITSESISTDGLGAVWTYRSVFAPQPTWPGPAKWDAYHSIKDLQSMRNYDPVFYTIVVGERLYYASSADDSIHCIDTSDGKELWRYTTDAPLRVAPAYSKSRLYFGSDDGCAYCISATDGSLVWKKRLHDDSGTVINNGRLISFRPCRTGVLVDGDTAYCSASLLPWKESYLCALDAETGSEQGDGKYIKVVKDSTLESPMLATSGRLVVMQGRSAPMMFDRTTGRTLGRAGKKGGCIALITEEEQLFYGPGPRTGVIAASKSMGQSTDKLASYGGARAMVAAGSISYIAKERELLAVDRKSGKKLWSTKASYNYDLILAGKTLFAGGRDEVAAFDADSGAKVWSAAVNGRAHGLSVANGALYVSTDCGDIVCFRPGAKSAIVEPAAEVEIVEPAPLIENFTSDGLVGRWVFQSNAVVGAEFRDFAGSNPISFADCPEFKTVNKLQAAQFGSGGLTIAADHKTAGLPSSNITAEAWVRLDKLRAWGGIIGALQDNGNYERGWVLGYDKSKFYFGLVGTKNNRLTYLKSAKTIKTGQWYHVVGTYDGSTLCIYVDGEKSGSSAAQKGAINYPPQAFFELAAYKDKDEDFPMEGMLQEVRLYDRSLSAAEIMEHCKSKQRLLPEKTESAAGVKGAFAAMGPYLQFTSSTTASVKFYTDSSQKCRIQLTDSRGGKRIFAEKSAGEKHDIELNELQLNERYTYSIVCDDAGVVETFGPYECDATFNYMPPRAAGIPADDAAVKIVDSILKQAPADRGVAVVVGCRFPSIMTELNRKSGFRVMGVDTDLSRIKLTRAKLFKHGQYGVTLSVRGVESYENLPLPSHTADLVINLAGSIDPKELKRILAPGGVAIMNLGDSAKNLEKGDFKGGGEWTHMYGMADNATFGGEHIAGAKSTADMEVAWLGRPGPRYQVDRQGRGPGPLASNGRLFGQGMDRILSLNSYNGTILWSLEIPGLARYNVPRDCSNWCCDDDNLYLAVRDGCWRIDAATGKMNDFYPVPAGERKDWNYDWGYVARSGDLLLGSNVKQGSTYKGYWGAKYWYDSASGALNKNVCSDRLFALDVESGRERWHYSNGIVLNSTISVSSNRIYFIECRNTAVTASGSRRIGMAELWQDQFMVALDVATGKPVWEKPLVIEPAISVCYMACAEGHIVVVSSAKGKYNVYVYDADTGEGQWNHTFGWGRKGRADHGSHLSRPVIVDGTLYVSPKVFNLADGKVLPISLPTANCGSYSACADSLIFRVKPVTRMWNRESGKLSGWTLLRPNCWISTIPANGMILSLEGGGGCSCGGWIETSFGFMPRSVR